MTYSNEDLARAFANGATSGRAANMEIIGNKIVGYGWAVYATRTLDRLRERHRRTSCGSGATYLDVARGVITLHDGWYGYSISTNRQLDSIRRYVDFVDSKKPMY